MFRGLIPPTPPLVIDKTRTVVLGGEQVTSQRLSVEMQEQSLADLQWMLRFIAQRDTVEQIKLGNPPSITTIDGKASEELSTAQKRVEVLFGSRLATQAMRMVETTLRLNIQKATNAHTGKLANVTANWRWRLVTPARARASSRAQARCRRSNAVRCSCSNPTACHTQRALIRACSAAAGFARAEHRALPKAHSGRRSQNNRSAFCAPPSKRCARAPSSSRFR